MKKNRLIPVFLLLCLTHLVYTQSEEKLQLSPAEKIFFGGNFSLQFGTVTFIELSPMAGYQFTPWLSGGLGFKYQYYRERTIFNTVFKTNVYGGRAFARVRPIKDLDDFIPVGLHAGILGYAEYELVNTELFVAADSAGRRDWIENVYIGGGLELPMSEKFMVNFLVLWNLNDPSRNLEYSNPLVRVGFIFFPFRKE